MSKLIIGLGNPGPKYAGTRHNVGFMVVDHLVEKASAGKGEGPSGWRHLDAALVKRGFIEGERVILAKPQTYMNSSGLSVARLLERFSIPLPDLLVIYDDLNLELGRLRLRRKGSAGGHNGMKSIIDSLGSEEFSRLRVGIGSPEGEDVIDYVLGKFTPDEKRVTDEAVERAATAVVTWVTNGIDRAMSEFNG